MADPDESTDDGYSLDRRSALTALGVGAVLGLGAFSGTVAAWERFDVCFRGCSEVWMIVGEGDVGRDPPTVAYVVVESEARPSAGRSSSPTRARPPSPGSSATYRSSRTRPAATTRSWAS